MDDPLVDALYARARQAKVPMYAVCAEAKVNKSTPSGWRRGHSDPQLSTLRKLEDALDRIEKERQE